jgi:hypothetical protein
MYWTTGILGFIFAVSPFVLGYSNNSVAMWTSILLGGSVIVASILEGVDINKGNWEYWVTGLVGLVAVAAPFLLGFGSLASAMWASVGIGLLLALVAGSKLYYGRNNYQ